MHARPNDRLRERRKKQRHALTITVAALLAALAIGTVLLLRLPSIRIHTVHAEGVHAAAVVVAVNDAISGSYMYAIPKDSIFFFSTTHIRDTVLHVFPDIEAVSIHRDSFSSISIVPTERTSVFVWCGATKPVATLAVEPSCFDTDSNGLLFASHGSSSLAVIANASTTIDVLKIYAPLDSGVIETNPIRAHVIHKDRIPGALMFVKALGTLGARTTAIVIHDDEADLYVPGGARVTYVLGHEADAAALAQAVLPKIAITDGTIAYLDLRFAGKAYIQRVGATSQVSVPTILPSSTTPATPTLAKPTIH